MDCETFHLELPDLIYGELDPARKNAGEAHLATCPGCTELLSDLQTVRTASPRYSPSPLLGSRIKLAARDALIGDSERAPAVTSRGGPLHMATLSILAACVCLTGFGLGIYYERHNDRGLPQARDPLLHVPEKPADLVREDQEPWVVEINDPGAEPKRTRARKLVPRAPEAWQRVLHDAAASHLEKGDPPLAREFYLRAFKVAPEGPLAAGARVGAAEALLRAGDPETAKKELQEARLAVLAGRLYGNEALLQRIAELVGEAERK